MWVAGWAKHYLSLGGQLTLIKSILNNLPLYYMSLFEMRKGIANRLEQLLRIFLWVENEESRKVHLVRWSEVTKPKGVGGLR